MLKIHKLIIGIRPATRMFRIPAVGGLVVDAVLDIRGKSGFSNDYYTQVGTTQDGNSFHLHNPENGNSLNIDRDNILFVKDYFGTDIEIDVSDQSTVTVLYTFG